MQSWKPFKASVGVTIYCTERFIRDTDTYNIILVDDGWNKQHGDVSDNPVEQEPPSGSRQGISLSHYPNLRS